MSPSHVYASHSHQNDTCLALDWFDVLDDQNRPVLTEREVIRNLQAIVTDADKTDIRDVRIRIPSSHSEFIY